MGIHGDRPTRGIEVIGYLHPFGGEPSANIHTRVYSFTDGGTLDYVYDLTGDTLTIWAGHRGSPSFYRGTFGEDGQTVTGGEDGPDRAGTRAPRPRPASPTQEVRP